MAVPRLQSLWILQIILCNGLLLEFAQSQGLSAIGPNVIRPDVPFTVSIANSLPQNAQLEISLSNLDDGVVLNSTSITISRKSAKSALIPVGPIAEGNYRISIQSLSAGLDFQEEVDLLYDGKTESVFVQLDKPVYKPGDLLRFRVVVLDINTRPVSKLKSVDVTLVDPNGNPVKRWPFGTLYQGVFEASVQLASTPLLGRWTLTAIAESSEVSKQMELKEYTLPKYSIKVKPTRLLTVTEKRIELVVTAAYTSGNPVEGTVTVDLYLNDVNRRRPDHSIINSIEGHATVEFDLDEELEVDGDRDFTEVFAKVSVVESFSNQAETVIESIPVYRSLYTITASKSEPMFLPEKPFTIQLIIRDHNGMPASGGKMATISILYDGDYFEDDTEQVEFEREPNALGVITLKIVPPSNAISFEMEVLYDGAEYQDEVYATESLSDQSITVSLNLNRYKVRPNKEVVFEIASTERLNHFAYTFLARGSVIDSGLVSVANKKKYSFRYRLLPRMAPKAKLIVSYTNRNYFIYDDLDLNFDTLDNDFEFYLDKDNYLPGQDVILDLKAASDSYVAFHGIDQSVLHLGHDGNLFTGADVLEDLDQYNVVEPDDSDPFTEMGMFLRTTLQVDAPYAENIRSRSRRSTPTKKVTNTVQIRTVFPETWLWRNYSMEGSSTAMTIEAVVPDTVTSWLVTGFALSPTLGLGIMNKPCSFTVKQPFYIIANLPYSIKREELAVIHVTVFNFLENSLPTNITLFNKNDEIEFAETSSNDPTRRTKPVVVPSNKAKSVSFIIKAKKLGEIAIKIEAVNALKADSVEHILRVIPESHLIERNEARFIDLTTQRVQSFEISLDIPRNADEGSVYIKFTLDPDILGTAIKNLDSLIVIPSGCGEQNMVKFVPNLVILDYLTETGTISEDIRAKTIKNLRTGYRNQLNYRVSDGSFSVFVGRRGGVFLTAFVAKSFMLASKYIPIDMDIVDQAFAWLLEKQQPDGRFKEVGDIFQAEIQGGLRSSYFALTAFVLAAILESEQIVNGNNVKVQRTINYLTNNLQNIESPYDLALSTYALSMLDLTISKPFLDKLVEMSTYNEIDGTRYWVTSSYGVEIAGYALQSYLAHGLILDAVPIVRWLTTQRYGQGGYGGTQDTFVGLKALALFAAKTSNHRNNYRVTVSPKQDKFYVFDIDNQKLAIQEQELDSATRNVNVNVNGVGTGVFQIAYRYNQNIVHRNSSFNLTVDLLPNSTYYRQELSVCVNFIAKDAYEYSNMALVEVFFPSGIVANEHSVRDLSIGRNIQKTELRYGGTSLVVYYIRLGAQPNCFGVTAERHFKVALHRPAHVVVYDYYDNGAQSDRFAIASYEGKVMQVCDVCEDEDCETLSCN